MIGSKKGEGVSAFLLGLLFGPFGILLALFSKGNRITCPHCRELVHKDATVCPNCQKYLLSQRATQPTQLDSSMWEVAPSRKCPFCAEFIKKEASVCRFCGRDVPSETAEFLEACKRGQEDKVKLEFSKWGWSSPATG